MEQNKTLKDLALYMGGFAIALLVQGILTSLLGLQTEILFKTPLLFFLTLNCVMLGCILILWGQEDE